MWKAPTAEEIDAARRMSPEEKLLAGPRLFDEERKTLTEEMRQAFPEADDATIQQFVVERLDIIHDRAGREYCLSLGLPP